jgi:hypothetical protein
MSAKEGETEKDVHDSQKESTFSNTLFGEEPLKKVDWSVENEKILVEWCDIAQCYKWLNLKAHSSYSYMNAWFTIPAIILSTISGTASFAQESIPTNYQAMAILLVGTVNISVGILTTIQQFLKISELNEAHRVAGIAWDKFARNIRIELAKAPDERPEAHMFLKYCRDEFDRLMETCPSIPEATITMFKKTFIQSKDTKVLEKMEKLKLPDICDIIVSAEETRHHWYKNTGKHISEIEMRAEKDLLERQKEMREKEQQMRDIESKLKEKQNILIDYEKQKIEKYEKLIHEYQQLFEKTNGRMPEESDIIEHFNGTIEENFLKTYFSNGDENV